MRAPVEWICDYVPQARSMTVSDMVEAYTRIGLEVEAVHTVPATTGPLLVGRVADIEELTGYKKPIRYTRVELGPGHGPDGGDGPRGIICGAVNFAVGDHVIVAPPGTVLPGGFEITARRTYGHVSDGMICSARELGIGDDHEGIVVLDADTPVGGDARALIGADQAVIEFAITPDRGYALSLRGLARELAAAFDLAFTDPADVPLRQAPAGREVTIVDTERCARFVAVEARGIDPTARSPWRVRRRLMAAGIRPISLAVDVTNYVMLETGHPLHAFDADTLDGGIVVRRAAAGEKLRTLDGQVRVLSDDDVVVADQSRAVSLAGVMGGEETEISARTTNVVIEAASWSPPSISRTVRRHRLPSEAARRYERVVDPGVSAVAAEAAAALLVRFGGGTLGGRTDAGEALPPPPVLLPATECERLTGRGYATRTIVRRLEQVGCVVGPLPAAGADAAAGAADDAAAGDDAADDAAGAAVLTVTPPSWRPDLTRPADLVEEVARLEGYDTIAPVLPAAPAGTGLTAQQRRRRRVATDLAAAGLTEVLSFPFLGDADLDALGIPAADPRRRAVRLANPLDHDRPLMATTLLPGLITTALRNIARGAKHLALFETGQVVQPGSDRPAPPRLGVQQRPTATELDALLASVPAQPVHVAALLTGQWEHSGWWGPGRAAEPSDAFALARRIGVACGITVDLRAADTAPWHPGRCAEVRWQDTTVGHAGELHPEVAERLGLPPRPQAVEIDLTAIPQPGPVVPPVVSPFPPVLLDVALVVDDETPADTVMAALRDGGGELVESIRLFDVYTGDQIPPGRKSLAFALVIRAADRTLTAAEATEVRDAAIAAAGAATGAQVRG